MIRFSSLALVAALLCGTAPVDAQTLRPDQASFRALYKELVETNTTLSSGSCTLAAERMAAHLRAAGYTDRDLTLFSAPDHPKEGGLVAVLPGADPKAKPILLLAHIDVVEARREDWTRDPFTFIEENGFFYARGVSDDKVQAAIFTDTMARLHGQTRPRRTVKLALTCGEETTGAFNGAQWLTQNKRDLIDAEFALNEGGGGRLDAQGKPLALGIQVSEKVYQDFTLEATNPGGHSSLPRPDNAIYQLATALGHVQAYKFPVMVDDTTRAFWTGTAKIVPSLAAAMNAVAANPQDKLAEALLGRDPLFNSTLRTTCIPTLLEGGHAQNALPQRARANVNCRIFPGVPIDTVQATLTQLVAAEGVTVTAKNREGKPIGHPAPLSAAVVGPATTLGHEMYPGLPLIPNMSTGASDSIYLAAAGIPSYGVPGILYEYDGGGIHGLNEHIRVKSVYDGRDYLFRLIQRYADAT
ncbi:M20/M25/M40 family metallo-hydrolase [Sphingomonas bacterium]|uniref:M20/M25/M40 family metallo-hydrolase n=1 Tax=Sphingomonas bacterium TaxID=1895847 RepID=UPI001575FD7C|nr:M20/M25/M40 family metallo-hydrolase [Sphingomonas bacterium]